MTKLQSKLLYFVVIWLLHCIVAVLIFKPDQVVCYVRHYVLDEFKEVVTVDLAINDEGGVVLGYKTTDPFGYERPDFAIVDHHDLLLARALFSRLVI